MKRTLLALFTAALFVAGAALAQDNPKGMGQGRNMPVFADFDANDDGGIDAEEFYAFRGKRMADMAAKGGQMKHAASAPAFEEIDTDGDGIISPDELSAHQAKMMETRRQGK